MGWCEVRRALFILAFAGCAPTVPLAGKACDAQGACPAPLVCVKDRCVENPCGGGEVKPSATLVPACRSWLGFYPGVSPDWGTALSREQTAAGLRFDVVHAYHDWVQDWPTADEKAAAQAGSLLLLDWSPKNFSSGALVSWKDIASGAQDAAIDARAKALAALPGKLWVTFGPQPEANVGTQGTAAEFAAAFRHVRQRAVAQGASNVVWALVLMGGSADPALYPGDDVVDWVGWPAYNSFSCGGGTVPWKTFSELIRPSYDGLVAQGRGNKPFFLTELACAEDPANAQRKAQWFSDVAQALPGGFPNLKLVVVHNSTSACTYRVGSSAASQQAFNALAASEVFQVPR